MDHQPVGGREIHLIRPDQGDYRHAVSHDGQELLSDVSLWSHGREPDSIETCESRLTLGRSNQVGPTTPVTFGESKANPDEAGDIEAVPLLLPARRLVCRR